MTWQPAWRIRELIARRIVTPTEVTEHFLERIAKLEPKLHAFDTLDVEGAREQARAATRAVESGATLGPLHGIPIAIMDTVAVKGFRIALLGISASRYDEIATERVRAAGAIIFGTTATYAWPVREGPRNPWDLNRDPGNSSRGSAVAVAAGMVPLAIGQDAAGSTRLPAAWSGCMGLATTRGLVPHISYEFPSLKTTGNTGPMARNARDCAMMLQAMAGRDGRDMLSTQSDVPDYSAHIEDGIANMPIAWTDDFGWSQAYWQPESAQIVELVRNAAFGLTQAGAKVEQIRDTWGDPRPVTVALGKFLPPSSRTQPPFDPEAGQRKFEEVWGKPQTRAPASLAADWPANLDPIDEYRAVAERRARMIDSLERVLGTHKVLISATTVMEPRPFNEWGYFGREFIFTSYTAHTSMMNLIGYPAISVPCGLRNGLPVGMQIIARQGQEDLLLRVAEAVQKLYPTPHPPSAI
ncbi:hypothetical protein A8G00_22815 [Sphingobium sp. SA916]|nr:hypothetical protein A8G00_22815 [Sphingobium sp. SA916]